MNKKFYCKRKNIGFTGEDIACGYLEKKGYQIIERNYRRKFGEIDIIAKSPEKILVFFEVKTLMKKNNFSYLDKLNYPQISGNDVNKSWIIRQLLYFKKLALKPFYRLLRIKIGNKKTMEKLPDINKNDSLLPEDNFSYSKRKRFKKISLWYANAHPNLVENKGFRLDLIAVEMKDKNSYKIKHYKGLN